MFSSWHISLHFPSEKHVALGKVWGDGEVFQDSTDHAEDWVEVGEWEALCVLHVDVVGFVLKDVGEQNVVVVSPHADVVLDHFSSSNVYLFNIWIDDKVEHGKVEVRFKVHAESGSSFTNSGLV